MSQNETFLGNYQIKSQVKASWIQARQLVLGEITSLTMMMILNEKNQKKKSTITFWTHRTTKMQMQHTVTTL